MSDQISNGRASGAPQRDWVEIVATLPPALAAVATAWSSYQATRWNGKQAKAAGRTNAIRIQRHAQPAGQRQRHRSTWKPSPSGSTYLLGVVLFAVALFFAG